MNETQTERGREFEEIRGLLEQMAEGIAKQFGRNCEVLVHDITRDPEETVVILKNGHVTGRNIGDGASEVVFEALRDPNIADRYNYITNSKTGRLLKSSTINVRGRSGDVVAVLCINYDIGELSMAKRVVSDFIAAEGLNGNTKDDGIISGAAKSIPSNVTDLLDQMIEESRKAIGKPVAIMTKDEKSRAICSLDKKGALLIRGSSERIADYYGISKYTLYNYLAECQNHKENL